MMLRKITDNYYTVCIINNLIMDKLKNKYGFNGKNIVVLNNEKVLQDSNIVELQKNNFYDIIHPDKSYVYSILPSGKFIVSETKTKLEIGTKHLLQSVSENHNVITAGELRRSNNEIIFNRLTGSFYHPLQPTDYKIFLKQILNFCGILDEQIKFSDDEIKSTFDLLPEHEQDKFLDDFWKELCFQNKGNYVRYISNIGLDANTFCNPRWDIKNVQDVKKVGNSICDIVGPHNLGNISQSITYEQPIKYGNIAKLGWTSNYDKEETLLCLDTPGAFPNDNGYMYGEMYNPQYCDHDEYPPTKENNILRIISFNLHNFHAVCAKGIKKDPDHTIKYIDSFKPDILLFQEYVPYIPINQDKTQYTKCNSVVPMRVDFSYVDTKLSNLGYTYNVKTNDFEYGEKPFMKSTFMGKAIYTKNEIVNVDHRVLGATNDNKDRGYLRIIYNIPNTKVYILIYNVHLTVFNQQYTMQELTYLLNVIDVERKFYGIENVIIMGDFNNTPFKNQIDAFMQQYHNNPGDHVSAFQLMHNDFELLNDETPSGFNQGNFTLDLVWVNKTFKNYFDIHNVRNNEKYKIIYKTLNSDHYPAILDIQLKYNYDNSLPIYNNNFTNIYNKIQHYINNNMIKLSTLDFTRMIIAPHKILGQGTSGNYPISLSYLDLQCVLKLYGYHKNYISSSSGKILCPYPPPSQKILKNSLVHPSDIELFTYEKIVTPLILNKNTPNLLCSYSKAFYFTRNKLKNTPLCASMLGNKIATFLCDNNPEFYNHYGYIMLEAGASTCGNIYSQFNNNEISQKAIIFEILYTLFVLYKYVKFQHLDFHSENCLMVNDVNYSNNTNKFYIYQYNNKNYYIPVLSHIPKIFDFDRSVFEGVKNPTIEQKKPQGRYQAEDRDDSNRFFRSIYSQSANSIKQWIDTMYNKTLNKNVVDGFVMGEAKDWPNPTQLLNTNFFDYFTLVPKSCHIVDKYQCTNFPNKPTLY